MANAVYPKFKEQALQGGVNLSAGAVKVVIVDAEEYTYNAAHEFLSDIPSGGRIAISPALANKTFLNGLFDADNVSIPSVTGDQSEIIVLFIDTGNPATSRLITYFDTGVTGLPVLPNGGGINVNWNASGIFQL
jgi:hypothetical protein